MSTFVAIDFETADPKRDSACAVGLVRVEGGRIVRRESALIRPPRGMNSNNQRVHGLSWNDVKDAPSFATVWAKLAPLLEGASLLVAHNAPFDRSVLRACCCVAELDAPTCEWVCTVELARKKLPGLGSYKLPDVCRTLGVALVQHHEARADAEAAALVYLALTGAAAPKPVPAPAPQTAPAPTWEPSGPCGEILDEVPTEHRSPAAVQMMRAAEQLGPVFAADLVRHLGRWFSREEPGRPRCGCGGPATRYSSLCADCGRIASASADAPAADPDTYQHLMGLGSALNRVRKSLKIKIDIGTTGRVAIQFKDRRTKQERRVPFRDQKAALDWLTEFARAA